MFMFLMTLKVTMVFTNEEKNSGKSFEIRVTVPKNFEVIS